MDEQTENHKTHIAVRVGLNERMAINFLMAEWGTSTSEVIRRALLMAMAANLEIADSEPISEADK